MQERFLHDRAGLLGGRQVGRVVQPSAAFLDVDDHRVRLGLGDGRELLVEMPGRFEDRCRGVQGACLERLHGGVLRRLPRDGQESQPIAGELDHQRSLRRNSSQSVVALGVRAHHGRLPVDEDLGANQRLARGVGDSAGDHVGPQRDGEVTLGRDRCRGAVVVVGGDGKGCSPGGDDVGGPIRARHRRRLGSRDSRPGHGALGARLDDAHHELARWLGSGRRDERQVGRAAGGQENYERDERSEAADG